MAALQVFMLSLSSLLLLPAVMLIVVVVPLAFLCHVLLLMEELPNSKLTRWVSEHCPRASIRQ